MDTAGVVLFIQTILSATWRLATPIIYASIGEVFTERSGVLNIGLEGFMLLGAFFGFAATFFTGNPAVGALAALVCGIIFGLLFAFFTVTIKANQIVVGAALNLIGLGLTGFLYRAWFVNKAQGVKAFAPINIPFLSDIPFLGDVLFRHNILVYCTVPLVLIAGFILYKTAFGLAVRSVGEHPSAADTAGVSVSMIRYLGVLIGTSLTSLGGAYLTLAHTNQFVEGTTTGRGFIALAVVVFGRWSPKGAFWASMLFGLFYALQLRLQAMANIIIPYQFLQALPYVMTLVTLIIARERTASPKALGVPYRKTA
ncbi:MAG: ABC transporter permease [Anaerolineae bacterium]